MLDHAMQYLKKGFSVIPVQKDKKPFIKWEPYQKQKPTIEEITTWFNKWPDAMIGICTGEISGLAVIDIDTEEGKEAIQEYIPDSLLMPIAETPKGGQHLYFKCPDPPLSNNTRVIPGCDLRCEGGYIIAPPSINGTGKGYKWLDGLSINEIEPPELPGAYISFINSFAFSIRGREVNDFQRLPKTSFDFQKGNRDNTLFHVANCLIKGGCEESLTCKVLQMLALQCDPPFPMNEIQSKIESALKRVERRERNISDEIKEWVMTSNGFFLTSDCFRELLMTSRPDQKAGYLALMKLCKAGILEKHGDKRGCFRVVDNQVEAIDFLNASSESLNVRWPFELEKLVKTLPKNIVIIAGEPNAGKTALLLNVAEMNQGSHEVYYFSSEMGDMELKDRLSKFTRSLNSWKVKFLERSSNFADVIKPDAINIIDFLEVHDEFYKVGAYIKDIFDKLNKGLAIIAIQKNKGNEYGLGGGRGLEKARLYLSMEPGKIKILKAKNWTDSYNNPNGLECSFKLVKGCHFIPEKWQRS